jgi:3-isopropylmalate dehydratase small subunit
MHLIALVTKKDKLSSDPTATTTINLPTQPFTNHQHSTLLAQEASAQLKQVLERGMEDVDIHVRLKKRPRK